MIYLDNGATTPVHDRVKKVLIENTDKYFGNPSSLHKLGIESEKNIKNSRKIIAKYMGVQEKSLVFTSGGSESNNYAIKGTASTFINRGKHIITTTIEHASVYNTFKHLEANGFEVEFLNVDSNGLINLEELEEKIRKDTILVSIMHVNNEIGSIQDLEKIGKLIKSKNENTIFHTDAVASFGKLPIEPKKWNVDLISVSGHKVYCPKGVGLLYIKEGLKITSLIHGGSQEGDRRAGTENTLGICSFGEAVSILDERNIKEDFDKLSELKKYTIEKLNEKIKDFRINGFSDEYENYFSPYVLNIGFKNVKGEVLLHYLEGMDIYVSTTSACSSKESKKGSRILEALNVPKDFIDGSIRITFSHYTTKEEIDSFIKALEEGLLMLRMFKK
jgi:cysteine desulfurase